MERSIKKSMRDDKVNMLKLLTLAIILLNKKML